MGELPQDITPIQGLPETSHRGSRGGRRGLRCGGLHRSGAAECWGNSGGFRNVSARWASTQLGGSWVSPRETFMFRGLVHPYIRGYAIILSKVKVKWRLISYLYYKIGRYNVIPMLHRDNFRSHEISGSRNDYNS